jgi:Helix-turn-helix domain
MKSHPQSPQRQQSPRFINPHRLFHGVWLPQWLEERPEISEKAKKLYAYLTYFAGSKGYAWPSFNHLAVKLHISRRYVIKLIQEPLNSIPNHRPSPRDAGQTRMAKTSNSSRTKTGLQTYVHAVK